MGLLDKVRNMFTEEIEETPIKKEVIQVEIPAPVVPEKKEEVIAESEVLTKEEKPAAPVFFDDKDFASLEKKEKVVERKPKKLEDKYRNKEEEQKIFRPTPIISPVYGVLDKNYKKEDISSKKVVTPTAYYDKTNITIDDVRRKAFGTLEDDLEIVIPSDDYEITEEKDIIEEPIESVEMLDDLMDPDYEPRFASKEEDTDMFEEIHDEFSKVNNDLEKIEDDNLLEEMENDSEVTEDDLTESDLFNLIDSMYDKKDDE